MSSNDNAQSNFLVMVREPWETSYQCHAICESKSSAVSTAKALRWKKGRSVKVTTD